MSAALPKFNPNGRKDIQKRYTASPTLTRFHQSKKFFKYVEGPVGSGKSTGCINEILMRAFRQAPNEHGERQSRWAIIRNTYPELKSTTIKTFEQWVPKEVAPVVYSAPIKCDFRKILADGTRVELEIIFIALETPEDIDKLLSLDLTGAYINECRETPWEIMEGLTGRVDRYPQLVEREDGSMTSGASEPGIIADSNPPNISHWLYMKFETGNIPSDFEKFRQPPAVFWNDIEQKWELNPDAENLKYLKPDYYRRQMEINEEAYIRVMLAGEYGASRKGRPVFSAFSESVHVAKAIIAPDRRWPLILGFDFGLMPACLFGQLTPRGLVITDEMPGSDEALEDFISEYVAPCIQKRYQGYTVSAAGDPAGRGRSPNDKRTSFDILMSFGIKAFPAYTNSFTVRKETVDYFLNRRDGLIISPHCTFLRETLATGYVWKEARNNKGGVVDKAEKNEYSHIADALQYLALWAKYGYRPQYKQPDAATKKTLIV
jgi:hypothetical protein